MSITKPSGKLSSGQRRKDDPGETLYQGPAFIGRAKRKSEREVALELGKGAELLVSSKGDLSKAERVVVAGHVMAGDYDVAGSGPSWSGRDWTLELERR